MAVLGCHQWLSGAILTEFHNIRSRVPWRATERCPWPVPISGAKNVESYFNPAAFSVPPNYPFGNAATTCFGEVRTPTLVLHARNDAIAPLSEGRFLASEIPGAEFVELDSPNHVLLEHEPAWTRFQDAVLEFTGRTAPWRI